MNRSKPKRAKGAKRSVRAVETRTQPRDIPLARFPSHAWDELFDRLSCGETLAEICLAHAEWPESHKLHQAIAASSDLIERYRNARRAGVMALSEELLPIADDSTNDYVERNGKRTFDSEAIQRSRLRIDTRLRLLEALDPTVFGKKIDLSNKDGSLAGAWSAALGVVNAEQKSATKH